MSLKPATPLVANVMRRLGPITLFAVLACAGCHSITEELPTTPPPGSAPLVSLPPIPAAPAPQPTPKPSPTAAPEDDPAPAIPGEGGGSSSCTNPVPPPVGRVNVSLHIVGASRLVLDSTPLVGPDPEYCKAIGFTDGRQFCPTRPEGDPQRFACDAQSVGRAADTGRFGPTWSANGRPCGAGPPTPYCENHPDNQFLVFAYGSGTFQACTSSGVCGRLAVP